MACSHTLCQASRRRRRTGLRPTRACLGLARRENFERQTARMREEARALRSGGAADDDGPGAYFVSLMPRAEFLTEAALATLTPTRTLTLALPTDH